MALMVVCAVVGFMARHIPENFNDSHEVHLCVGGNDPVRLDSVRAGLFHGLLRLSTVGNHPVLSGVECWCDSRLSVRSYCEHYFLRTNWHDDIKTHTIQVMSSSSVGVFTNVKRSKVRHP